MVDLVQSHPFAFGSAQRSVVGGGHVPGVDYTQPDSVQDALAALVDLAQSMQLAPDTGPDVFEPSEVEAMAALAEMKLHLSGSEEKATQAVVVVEETAASDVPEPLAPPKPDQRPVVGNVAISVRHLGGAEIGTLEVHARTKIGTVKNIIEALYEFPTLCQQLVLGTKVLDDKDDLTSFHIGDAEPLIMTVVASYDRLYDHVEGTNRDMMLAAVDTLGKLASTRDERVFNAAALHLEKGAPFGKQVAVQVIAQTVGIGHEGALTALLGQLHDPCVAVRKEALGAVLEVAKRGDDVAVNAVLALISDPDNGVRKQALETLTQIANYGNTRVLEAIQGRLEHPRGPVEDTFAEWCPEVRVAAIRALKELSATGDRQVAGALRDRLADPHDVVRWEAVQAYPCVVYRGDDADVEALLECLADENCGIRRAAVRALASAANHGNYEALQGLGKCLADDHVPVRQAAVEALGQLANKGDILVVERLCVASRDPEHVVRLEATQAIVRVAEDWHRVAFVALVARLNDVNVGVRRIAVRGVEMFARSAYNASSAFDALRGVVDDEDAMIQSEVLKVLAQAMMEGNEHAQRMVRTCLKHSDGKVAAERAQLVLREVELSGCPDARAFLVRLLGSE